MTVHCNGIWIPVHPNPHQSTMKVTNLHLPTFYIGCFSSAERSFGTNSSCLLHATFSAPSILPLSTFRHLQLSQVIQNPLSLYSETQTATQQYHRQSHRSFRFSFLSSFSNPFYPLLATHSEILHQYHNSEYDRANHPTIRRHFWSRCPQRAARSTAPV